MPRCPVTGIPVDVCDCGGCWDDDDDPLAEAVAQAWRDDGSDGEDALIRES